MDFNQYVEGDSLGILYTRINVRELVGFLQNNIHITKLNLRWRTINNEDVKELAKLTHLTELCLHQNEIGDKGAEALANGNLSRLTKFYLRQNGIGDQGAEALSKLFNLTELNLRWNEIGSQGAESISKLSNLTELNLDGNRIGDQGAEPISKLSNLTKLDLGENNIGDQGAEALANGNFTRLTELDLTGNEVSRKDAEKYILTSLEKRRSRKREESHPSNRFDELLPPLPYQLLSSLRFGSSK